MIDKWNIKVLQNNLVSIQHTYSCKFSTGQSTTEKSWNLKFAINFQFKKQEKKNNEFLVLCV